MGFEGQTVWITGASSGIGEALAGVFARLGARLVLSARREGELERVRAGLPRADAHRVVAFDVADEEAVAAAAREVLADGRRLDVLVLNAGITQRALARDTALAVDRRLFDVDFFGPVALAKAVLPAFRAQGGGRIVVVSSLVGKVGTPLRSGYAASKHALHGFFESLRAEEHAAGVRVTMAMPGFIRTPLPITALTGDGSPQGRMDRAQLEGMAPEECAERIVRAVARGKDEVLVGGKERWVVPLARLSPGLVRRILRRARVT
ncbi:MAG TPA: SDR family oxidoreductase [Thermoanaerobaculia bacterium]